MNKTTIATLTTVLIVLIGINYNLNQTINTKEEKIKIIENEVNDLYEELTNNSQELQQYKNELQKYKNKLEKIQSEEENYVFYDIPLSKEIQIYTQNLCKEYGIDYLLVISVLKLESNFQADLISETSDLGIAQINSTYISWYAELAELDLENYNPFDIKDSIAMCIAGLDYYRDYWLKRGIINEETLIIYTLNTYNMGYNYKNYIIENGTIHRDYNLVIAKHYNEIKNLEI